MEKYNLIFLILAIFMGCSTEERTEDPSFDSDITIELRDKSELPAWLADYASYLENSPEGRELIKASENQQSGIYRFEWNNQTYYEICTTHQNALHTIIYTAEGVPVELTKNYYDDFSKNVRNWTIVYIFQPQKYTLYYESPNKAINIFPIEQNENTSDFLNRNCWGNCAENFYFNNPNSNECYLINNERQLKKLYKGSEYIPYNTHMSPKALILGRVKVPEYAKVVRQDYTPTTSTFKLYIEKKEKIGVQSEDIEKFLYFWACYPPLSADITKLKVAIIYNNKMPEDSINCISPDFDLHPFIYSDPYLTTWYGPCWYMESYTTSDGIKHLASPQKEEQIIYIQFRNANYDNHVVKGKLFCWASDKEFYANFETTPKIINSDNTEGDLNIEPSLPDILEDDYLPAEFFRSHIGEVKQFVYNGPNHITFIISDTERMEFCYENHKREKGWPNPYECIDAYINENRHLISYTDFERCVVGYGWKVTEEYEMDENSFILSAYSRHAKGNYSCLEFTKEYVHAYSNSNNYVSVNHFWFSEYQNLILIYNDEYILLNVNEKEMRIIKKGKVDYYNYGHNYKVKDYYYIVLQRMTDEELQKFKENY